jgi:hypothetical protein
LILVGGVALVGYLENGVLSSLRAGFWINGTRCFRSRSGPNLPVLSIYSRPPSRIDRRVLEPAHQSIPDLQIEADAMKTRAGLSVRITTGMCPAPRALEIRRDDANRPTTAPGSPRDRARPPLGKASCRIRAATGIGSACGRGASPTPDLREPARDAPTYTFRTTNVAGRRYSSTCQAPFF